MCVLSGSEDSQFRKVFMLRCWCIATLGLVASGCGFGGADSTGPQVDAAADAFTDAMPDASPCSGLACSQVVCPGGAGATSSISGTVYAPNGTLPLSAATVYVPIGAVAPISVGASCDRCANRSGQALVRTTTDAKGQFVLANMPVTSDVPVVIQLGKWRRQIRVPMVASCVDTAVAAELTRLPRNKVEGDIPAIALSTGERDAMECLLRKVGLDDSEFTVAGGAGRVHMFAGFGGAAAFDPSHGGGSFSSSTTLWASEASLSAYDVVLLSCEGDPRAQTKPPTGLAAMKAYADKGGRVLASHWHNYWLQAGPPPWNDVLTVNSRSNLGTIAVDVDPGFAKSATLSAWLTNVGASPIPGKLPVVAAQHTMVAINPRYAEQWLHLATTANGVPTIQYASMTTPIEAPKAEKCGRVVVSDIHASTVDQSATHLLFPSQGCTSERTQLTEQEKMLAFAVFDIAACVGDSPP